MPQHAGFRIRVDDVLRADFIAACKRKDRRAAQVLRVFMHRNVEEREVAFQVELFREAPMQPHRTNEQD